MGLKYLVVEVKLINIFYINGGVGGWESVLVRGGVEGVLGTRAFLMGRGFIGCFRFMLVRRGDM